MNFLFKIYGDNVVLKNFVFTNWDFSHSYNLVEWIGNNGEMRNCTFINNSAIDGGSLDWTGINGLLINCTFVNNEAENEGAIYSLAYPLSIQKSNFIDNSADDTAGALYLSSDNSTVMESIFINNTASTEGAMYCDFNDGIMVMNFKFYNNSAEDFGGAVMVEDYANITGSTFYNNTAGIGGAVYSETEGYFTNSTFTANRADNGGAIVMFDGEVSNSTFTQNYANSTGGEIYNAGTSKVIMSIFSDNTGYSSVPNLKTKIDIYNNDGSLEDVVIFGNPHNNYEKHLMASWRKDLLESGFTLLTAAITTGAGWGIAASLHTAFAPIISMGVNAVICGVLGGGHGLIYAADHQDYSTFWGNVLKGVGRGLQFSPFGGAINGMFKAASANYMMIGLNRLVGKTLSKSVALSQSIVNKYQKGSKIVYFS